MLFLYSITTFIEKEITMWIQGSCRVKGLNSVFQVEKKESKKKKKCNSIIRLPTISPKNKKDHIEIKNKNGTD